MTDRSLFQVSSKIIAQCSLLRVVFPTVRCMQGRQKGRLRPPAGKWVWRMHTTAVAQRPASSAAVASTTAGLSCMMRDTGVVASCFLKDELQSYYRAWGLEQQKVRDFFHSSAAAEVQFLDVPSKQSHTSKRKPLFLVLLELLSHLGYTRLSKCCAAVCTSGKSPFIKICRFPNWRNRWQLAGEKAFAKCFSPRLRKWKQHRLKKTETPKKWFEFC